MSFNSTFELVICSKYRATVLCFMWFSVINIIIDCRYYRNLLIYYTLIVVSIWDSKYRDTKEYNKKTFPPFVSAFNFFFFLSKFSQWNVSWIGSRCRSASSCFYDKSKIYIINIRFALNTVILQIQSIFKKNCSQLRN